jgi:putative oxidoreductase
MAGSISATDAGGRTSRTLASSDEIAFAGRLLIAAIFVVSGLGKIAQPAATIAYMTAAGLPLAPLGLAGSALIEVGGGLALILGYRTRFAATVLALFALVTALVFHSAFADQNQFVHFFKNIAIAGGLLQVVAFGGGRLSLDARLGRRAK